MTRLPLTFTVDLNVLNHLGIGLYSSTPAVITEVIANAWDAEAENVWITVDPDNDVITVEDDGHGMTESDVRAKFLNVGYTRREAEPSKQLSKTRIRRVMGRKGIGKLAMFSLADHVELTTIATGEPQVAFGINVPNLRKKIRERQTYTLETIRSPKSLRSKHGTRIRLTKLNSRINKTDTYLRPRLARRFSIIGDEHKFKIELNNHLITRGDRGFYGDIQFLWSFDKKFGAEITALAINLASITEKHGRKEVAVPCIDQLVNQFSVSGKRVAVRGYIATVDKPAKLGKGDESINMISIFANGRVFQEDILADLGDARVFNNYLIGEVHADFLDSDDIDRSTASREAIKRDDVAFQVLRAHLKSCLTSIRDQWDIWRQQLGYAKTGEMVPAIKNWIESFTDARDRKLADRLMTSIANLSISNDEDRDREAKSYLYRSAIVGFEKLRLRDQLGKLEAITDINGPEFRAIFTNVNDVEETMFFDITRSRLEVIEKFDKEIVQPKKLEKVAQEYLFKHLWLLDPSWDRVSGSAEMEVKLTTQLKRACPEERTGARLDIAYRTSAARHVIVELKRPGKDNLKFDDLLRQGRRYINAMEQYLKDHPDMFGLRGRLPPIDV